MAITSIEILEDSPQADGNRHIGVRFISHTGQEVIRRFWADKNFDKEKDVDAMIPNIETYMANEEAYEVCGKIEDGEAMPKLNFATIEQVKALVVEQEIVREAEIIELTVKKDYLSEVK